MLSFSYKYRDYLRTLRKREIEVAEKDIMICFMALLIFRILENRLEYKYTSSQIIRTLSAMSLNILPGDGYRPNYTRSDITDALHESAGFRTDTEIITSLKMKRIIQGIKKG